MSNIHTCLDALHAPPAFVVPSPITALLFRLGAALDVAPKLLLSAFRNHLAAQRIERFSDHRLDDIGFERDWDRTIIRRQR